MVKDAGQECYVNNEDRKEDNGMVDRAQIPQPVASKVEVQLNLHSLGQPGRNPQ